MLLTTEQKQAMRSNSPENIKFCFPAMHGHGAMHSKLQILKFDDYLRIVIPTGNLVPHDWGETGVLENGSHILAITRFHHVLTEWLTDGVPHRLTAPDIGGSALFFDPVPDTVAAFPWGHGHR